MEFTFALDGNAIEESCRDLERFLNAELSSAVQSASRLVRDAAKAGHAYQDRTGDLTRSIRVITLSGRATDGTLSGGVIATMFYASFVEDGTSRMRPYQYLFTAYYLNSNEILQLRDDALENAVFRAGLR